MRGVMLFAAAAVALVAARTPADDDKPAKADKPAKVETLELAGLTGKVPAGWKSEKPGAMRKAQYKAPKAGTDKDDAELSVFEFKGGSGSVKQNFDRQLAVFDADGRTVKETKAKVGAFEADVQDVAGTFKKKPFPMATDFTLLKDYRQLYVVFEDKEKVQYYLKFLGPKATVEKHKKAFDEFLESFK